MNRQNVDRALVSLSSLDRYLEKNDYAGHEYDDLLASKLVRFLTFGKLPLQILAVQVAKRFFIDLRPLLQVPKLRSTKGCGFMVRGYLSTWKATGDERWLRPVRPLLDWLLKNASSGYAGICWGNDFDYASRGGMVPKHLPTVVWTSHIQEAFDVAFEVTKDEEYKEIVCCAAEFVEKDLQRLGDSTGICLAYAPGIMEPVHNANLLGAAALLRGWRHTKKKEHLELAKKAIEWSVSRINPDGSWFYGDPPMLHWIDNYHTAYNLDCLSLAHEIGGDELVSNEIVSRTYAFWRDHFFLSDGTPKFYFNRIYPLDIQATAQAIESFAKYAACDGDALSMAWRVVEWAMGHMQKKNGAFRYRIYRNWTNNLEPIHWGQATMLSALGQLLHSTMKLKNEPIE